MSTPTGRVVLEQASARRSLLSSWRGPQPTFDLGKASDEDLVRMTRDGEDSAFDELVTRFGGRLYGLALSSLGNEDQAADAVCDAFLSARGDVESFDGRCSPGTWLYLHAVRAVFAILKPGRGNYSVISRASA